MIQTNTITISTKQYFKLLASLRFTQTWYIYLLPFLGAAGFHFFMEESSMLVNFLLVYGVINPLWILVYLYFHAHSKKAAPITTPRSYVVDGQKIIATFHDGNESSYDLDSIYMVKKKENSVLIYFSKSEFIWLPYDAFEENHKSEFLALLQSHGH